MHNADSSAGLLRSVMNLRLGMTQYLSPLLTSLIPARLRCPVTHTFQDLFSICALAIAGPWPGTQSLTSSPLKILPSLIALWLPYLFQALLLPQLSFRPSTQHTRLTTQHVQPTRPLLPSANNLRPAAPHQAVS